MSEFDAGSDYCYITTVGRSSGRPHTVEIWFAAVAHTLYVLAGSGERADFVRNARKTPAVTIRIGKKTAPVHSANARIVTEEGEDALARRLLLEKYASNNDLAEWGRTALPVAFDLTS